MDKNREETPSTVESIDLQMRENIYCKGLKRFEL
jgi:hypothetical protein